MTVTVAVAQMDPQLSQVSTNLDRVEALFRQAWAQGAALVVFPECATTGYGFDGLGPAYAVAEEIPGPTTRSLVRMCREASEDLTYTGAGPYLIVGLLERGPEGRSVYNTAVLVGPEGLIGRYRKAHLPLLGVDRFATPGDTGFEVFETEIGRVGLVICYDLRFPEAMRALALRGADIIALPTNWPDGSQNAPAYVTRTRALENRVFVMACNRCGAESGFWFFGQSQILDPGGQVLAEAGEGEALRFAEIEPLEAREKRIVLRPGAFEMDTVGDRRPDLYDPLISR